LGKAIRIKNQKIPDGKKRLAGQLEVGSIGRHNKASVYGVGNMIFNYIWRINSGGPETCLENSGFGESRMGIDTSVRRQYILGV
jgi:hypothetical protein